MFPCCLQNIQWQWTLESKAHTDHLFHFIHAGYLWLWFIVPLFKWKSSFSCYLYTSVWQPVTAITWKIYFWLKLSWDRSKGCTWLILHTRASQCDILQHINGCDNPCHEKVKNMKENSCFTSNLPRIIQSTVYKDRIIKTLTSFCGDLAHTDSSMYFDNILWWLDTYWH